MKEMVLLLLPPKEERFFVLFETKENQKVLTGPNSHPLLKYGNRFVYEFLKALFLPGA